MVVVPAVRPVTIPSVSTVATVVLDEVQVPFGAALYRSVVSPTHTSVVPVIVPALGNAFTVTVVVVVAMQPDVLVTV